MGMGRETMAKILWEISGLLGQFHDLRYCDLGSQEISKSAISILLRFGYVLDTDDIVLLAKQLQFTPAARVTSARKFLTHLGFRYESLDWNCEHGAIPVDLSQRLRSNISFVGKLTAEEQDRQAERVVRLLGACDVVSDLGTAEHVGETDPIARRITAQYELFRNVHELCRPNGGLMIHSLPLPDCYPNHGAFEYEMFFFHRLAELAGYRIAHVEPYWPNHNWGAQSIRGLWRAILRNDELKGLNGTFDYMINNIPWHDNRCNALVWAALIRMDAADFVDQNVFSTLPGLYFKGQASSSPKAPRMCDAGLCKALCAGNVGCV